MKLRAETSEEKAEVMNKILKIWQESLPSMRLGQMLLNLVETNSQLWLIEDQTIVERLEEWEAKIKEKTKI